MESEFNPLTTTHVDLEIEEVLPEICLEANKFELWFQPVYELLTGKVIHNEVLVRWRDNLGNLRQPQELLAALQSTQLLNQLDRIVVQKSIEVLSQNDKVTVSINLSNEIFEDQTFSAQLQSWLIKYNVAAPRICFEIEEEMICHSIQQAISFITELQQLGCHIAIDNYTGRYFSLLQLQEMPISMIKLDRSFAKNSISPAQKQLAIAISQTSKILKKQCIFKGINDKYSLSFANDLGVKGVQGYSLGKPQEKPKTFGLIGLLIVRIIALLILLYIFKSMLGINLFKDRHAWEVILDFVQSIFDSK